MVETGHNKGVKKWKRLSQLKNQELHKFCTKSDFMLDILWELHQQRLDVPVALADKVNAERFLVGPLNGVTLLENRWKCATVGTAFEK